MGGGNGRAAWGETPAGRYLEGRKERLILALTEPRPTERLLDIGCGCGQRLELFFNEGCNVTGIDSSPVLLDEASRLMAQKADLRLGEAEDLPFDDNEFDLVTMVASLEAANDPARALAEAIRVCRGRVFIGVRNRCSFMGVQGDLTKLFPPPPGREVRSCHLVYLSTLIRRQLGKARTRWGSVLFLPWGWYRFGAPLEERIPILNNPFGAFLGITSFVNFSLRPLQDVIPGPLSLDREGRRPLTGVVQGMHFGPARGDVSCKEAGP